MTTPQSCPTGVEKCCRAVPGVMGEVWRTGPANPARLSMESRGTAPRSASGRKKRAAKPARERKAHDPSRSCARTLHASASGMAKTQEQRIAYLTYPVRAGITVTFSRGISPHSAASLTKPARCPVIHLYVPIVQHAAPNCNRDFSSFRVFYVAAMQNTPERFAFGGEKESVFPLWKRPALTLPAGGSRWTSW